MVMTLVPLFCNCELDMTTTILSVPNILSCLRLMSVPVLVILARSGYETALKLYNERNAFPAFNIPTVGLPATIDAMPAMTSVGVPLTREESERDLERFLKPVQAAHIKTTATVITGSPARAGSSGMARSASNG